MCDFPRPVTGIRISYGLQGNSIEFFSHRALAPSLTGVTDGGRGCPILLPRGCRRRNDDDVVEPEPVVVVERTERQGVSPRSDETPDYVLCVRLGVKYRQPVESVAVPEQRE